MRVRPETPADHAAITAITEAAFGTPREARMVQAIRASDGFVPELSLVADEDGEIVGHVILSYVSLAEGGRLLELGPISVRPDRQRTGIGGALIRAALSAADARREPLVLVLGHPSYYPRFGFRRASDLGILPPDEEIPDAAWMAVPFRLTSRRCAGESPSQLPTRSRRKRLPRCSRVVDLKQRRRHARPSGSRCSVARRGC